DRFIQHCHNHGGHWYCCVVRVNSFCCQGRPSTDRPAVVGVECEEFAEPGGAQFEIMATRRSCPLGKLWAQGRLPHSDLLSASGKKRPSRSGQPMSTCGGITDCR